MATPTTGTDQTFLNPVYKRSFPDPFVLKFRGQYFAYSTGHAEDGLVFQVLQSADLVNWSALGGAMRPLDTGDPFYWAPEVTYHNGKFYLYYSVGNEALMHIRVAVSDRPDAGFVDAGKRLTFEEFAIDAHVFRDDDGVWFMFYATDFLTHSHIGTGTVVDRMTDPFTLAGQPRPVTRALYDWQVYDPERKEKGGVRWHTVEGPYVLRRKGRYYEIFSGGNWQNVSYGVSFAVSDQLEADREWQQYSDGTKTLPILRTLPDRVIGPGHNSVIRGPNNRELYCVYHSWVDGERVLDIDRMDFAGGDRIFVTGPTYTPQPVPYPATIGSFRRDGSKWHEIAGRWNITNGELMSAGESENEIRCDTEGSFLCEVYARSAENAGSRYGVVLRSDSQAALSLMIEPISRMVAAGDTVGHLPGGFDPAAWHLIRTEVDGRSVVFSMDEVELKMAMSIPFEVSSISLASNGPDMTFSAFSLTSGFEERFEDVDINARGWTANTGTEVADGLLNMTSKDDIAAKISKPVTPRDYELVVNVCLRQLYNDRGRINFGCGTDLVLAGPGPLTVEIGGETIVTIDDYQLGEFRQFRIVCRSGIVDCFHETDLISSCEATPGDEIVISVTGAEATLDMVRFTAL
jgi:GH43 family beta-xylosidase